MVDLFFQSSFWGSVVASIVGSLGFYILTRLYVLVGRRLTLIRRSSIEIYYPSYYLVVYISILVLAVFAYLLKIASITNIVFAVAFATIMFVIAILSILYDFRKVGLSGVDVGVKKAKDYQQALSLVKSDFVFLGVGANKLTRNESEFESAMRRASSEASPARLLLCDPRSPALIKIAKKANKSGRSVQDFSINVEKSLERLARLKDKGLHLDVRLYMADEENDMPIFRLMFFNNAYCLTSYTIFGVPGYEGEQLPQLHIVKGKDDHAENSFYSAFEKYYERLWNKRSSKKWNHKEWLK